MTPIQVNFDKLPSKYLVKRGATVTHLFVCTTPNNRDAGSWIEGHYLCDERNYFFSNNTSETYLSCMKCLKFYPEVLGGEIEKRYKRLV